MAGDENGFVVGAKEERTDENVCVGRLDTFLDERTMRRSDNTPLDYSRCFGSVTPPKTRIEAVIFPLPPKSVLLSPTTVLNSNYSVRSTGACGTFPPNNCAAEAIHFP